MKNQIISPKNALKRVYSIHSKRVVLDRDFAKLIPA